MFLPSSLRRALGRGPMLVTALSLAATASLGGPVGTTHAVVPGDNGKIAFSGYRNGNFDVYAANADGSGEVRLTTHTAFDGQPDWSPDGSMIAFVSQRNGASNGEIYVMNADGSGQTRLTSNTWHDGQPVWSPDGSRIAYASNTPSNVSEIFVMNADGSGITQLTFNGYYDSYPTWSPDGSKIAFSSIRNGAYNVFVMNPDGSGEANLTQDATNSQAPSWAPDGSKIAFSSHRDGNWEIYTMDPDGSNQVNVTQSPGDESLPSWSPDGLKFAFNRYTDASFTTSHIFTINADGTGETQLTTVAGINYDPAWEPVPSADLALGIAATPEVARSGKPLTYLITVHNAGPSNAQNVVVTDTLPAGARFVAIQASGGSCITPAVGATGTITCQLGFLPSGTDGTAQIVVKVVVKKTTLLNTASVTSTTFDPDTVNNTATIATNVR